jgi:large subunit ribosomal protein L6
MSRIGKKVIELPKGVEATVAGNTVTVKGSNGTLSRAIPVDVAVKIENGIVTLTPAKKNISNPALWGTCTSHIVNMVEGVHEGFHKKLVIEGIGYKSEVKGQDLVLALGFSHPVKISIPQDLKVTAEKNIITVSGASKELVGQWSANVRALKKPEPYKGKGIRYETEVVRRKQGKKSV